jgi:hypothetical protein
MTGCDDDDAIHDTGLRARLPCQLFELAQCVTGGLDDCGRTISECFAQLARQRGHAKAPS